MANVQFTNYALASANDSFSAIWKLSRAMKKAGWTYIASGSGTGSGTPERSGLATNDLWGGNADPALDSYPSFASASTWWCAQGPSTVKIPFTVASTGTFLRGEKITQATSAAEGELIGYEYDGSSTGHLVVLPRVGTFNNTNVITGFGSGATLTPSGTIDTFVCQVVLQKSSANLTHGSVLVQRVSSVTEAASRFSVLALTAAGCTNSVCPAGGGTGNGFPANGSWVVCGDFSSGSAVHGSFFGVTASIGRAQICATNVIPSTGVSADGTFWVGVGVTSTSTKFNFWGYFRMDNSEDGDVDPFATYKASNVAYNNANIRLISGDTDLAESNNNFMNRETSFACWKAWRRRGFGTDEQFVSCYGSSIGSFNSNVGLMTYETGTAETVACSYTTKRVREPILISSTTSTKKTRKGTVRWLHQVQGGTTFDTYDSKLRFAVMAPTVVSGSVIIGPYDGTTAPLQS